MIIKISITKTFLALILATDKKWTLVDNDTTWGLNIHSPAKSELESCSISKEKTATYLAGLRKSG
jgi:hypothetical protein